MQPLASLLSWWVVQDLIGVGGGPDWVLPCAHGGPVGTGPLDGLLATSSTQQRHAAASANGWDAVGQVLMQHARASQTPIAAALTTVSAGWQGHLWPGHRACHARSTCLHLRNIACGREVGGWQWAKWGRCTCNRPAAAEEQPDRAADLPSLCCPLGKAWAARSK